jgi:hypothetical protein
MGPMTKAFAVDIHGFEAVSNGCAQVSSAARTITIDTER